MSSALSPTDIPKVLALVLNWNGAPDTIACVQSLRVQSYPRLEILVLDNASTDDSVATIRATLPDVELVETGANLGYGGGNNLGMRIALEREIPFVLVLNDDTVLEEGCVSELVRAAEKHPEAAALAPKSYVFEQPGVLYSVGGTWDPAGYPRLSGFGSADGPEFATAREVDWLNGCALLFRSESLRSVGLFDERYFHTFEDTDWSLRARRAGFSLRVVPEARLGHRFEGSLGESERPQYTYYYTRNHLLFVELHLRGLRRIHGIYGVVVRCLRALKRARKRGAPQYSAIRRAMLRGIVDYFGRRFGMRPLPSGSR